MPSVPSSLPDSPARASGQLATDPSGALLPELGARADLRAAAGHATAVQRMFDRISPTYDLLNRLLSLGIDQRWRARALSVLFAGLPDGPVLDLCAGTGDLARAIEDRAAGRRIVAADFSRDMLLAGRHKAPAGAGLAQADAMRLPFRDEAFAGAVCGFGIRNVSEPRAAIAEVHRALKPGGRFVVLEFYRPTRIWTHLFHTFYGRLLLPAVGTLVSGDGSAYRYLSKSMLGFMTRAEFAQAMTDAGFRDVGSRDLTLGIASLIWGVK